MMKTYHLIYRPLETLVSPRYNTFLLKVLCSILPACILDLYYTKRLTFLSCNEFTGMPIDVKHNASQVGGDDDSDWFHRNDAYQMQTKTGGTTPILIAQSNNVATGSITQLSGSIITCIT